MLEGLIDSHLHTRYSDDGSESIENMIQAALTVGLQGIVITDHCDLLHYDLPGYAQDVNYSYVATQDAMETYDGLMDIYSGVELGDALQFEKTARILLAKNDYDMVLGSCHWNKKNEDIYHMDFTTWSDSEIQDYLFWYYDYLRRLAASPYCDVIAHLTYPLRYIVGKHSMSVPFAPYERLIDEILRTIAGEGKALELNTAGWRGALKESAPPLWIAVRFRQLGGQYVTLGSDAHKKQDVGADFVRGVELLRNAGFSQYTYFRKRQPRQAVLPKY